MSNTKNANAKGSKQATKTNAKTANGTTTKQTKPTAKELKAENLKNQSQKAKGTRPNKWNYPEDIKTAKDQKKWRRNARQERAALEAKIEELTNSKEKGAKKELGATQKELDAFMQANYIAKEEEKEPATA